MQQKLDSYGAGIQIDQVQMQKVDPPAEVIDAFRDVQAARADKERCRTRPSAYANKVVPEARGEAERILQGAEGYRSRRSPRRRARRRASTGSTSSKEGARGHPQAYLPGNDGARARRRATRSSSTSKGGGSGVVPYLPLDQLSPKKPQGAELSSCAAS